MKLKGADREAGGEQDRGVLRVRSPVEAVAVQQLEGGGERAQERDEAGLVVREECRGEIVSWEPLVAYPVASGNRLAEQRDELSAAASGSPRLLDGNGHHQSGAQHPLDRASNGVRRWLP